MRSKIKIVLVITFCGVMLSSRPIDGNLMNSMRDSLNDYIKDNPQEKLFLHLSQPYYANGDHLWYKIYQVDAFTNKPKSLSGSVYVELASFNGNKVLRQTIRMKGGAGHGDFIIPDSLPTGRYELHAWTNWMRNFKASDSFHQNITIVNLNDTSEFLTNPTIKPISQIALQFFPEGGNLIHNLNSQIAFKATDQAGAGISIQGKVYDDQNELVTGIETLPPSDNGLSGLTTGLGRFTLVPQIGRSYTAKVVFEDKEYSFQLPPVANDGVQLSANKVTGEQSINTTIRATGLHLNEQYLLLFQSQGEIIFSSEGILKDEISLNILDRELKHGINQIILFDSFGKEIRQRLVFSDKSKEFSLNATSDKNAYGTREKVSVKIEARDSEGKPIAANLSLLVRDKNQLKSNDVHNDIATQLMLVSEFGKDPRAPAFTLSDHSDALDLLLITKKWERFDWNKVRNPVINKNDFQIEQGFSWHGQVVTSGGQGHLLDRSNIVMSRVGVNPYFRNQFLYDTAQFTFKELTFENPGLLDVQVISKQTLTEQIEIITNSSQRVKSDSDSSIFITDEMRNYFHKQQLRRRISRDYQQKQNIQTSKADEVEHFEADDIKILKDFLPFADMRDIIREILPNVKLRKNKKSGEMELVIFDKESFTHTRKPTFMIDGILEFDQQIFLNLDVDNVASIEVVRSKERTAIFGPFGWGGMIIVHTYDNSYRSGPKANFTTVEIEGFHRSELFPVPNTPELDSSVPDLRALIYWNSEIVTDENGETTITFYTSDEVGDFEISVEGITSTGIPLNANHSFSVRKSTTQ